MSNIFSLTSGRTPETASDHYAYATLASPHAAVGGLAVFDTFTAAGSIGAWGVDNSTYTVTEAGLYVLYAQITWPTGDITHPEIGLAITTSSFYPWGASGPYAHRNYDDGKTVTVGPYCAYLPAGGTVAVTPNGLAATFTSAKLGIVRLDS